MMSDIKYKTWSLHLPDRVEVWTEFFPPTDYDPTLYTSLDDYKNWLKKHGDPQGAGPKLIRTRPA